MSSCLTHAGRTYSLDLENIVKSPSSSSRSHSSSPSSTLSDSTNSSLTISTRKPRTPRKRPNQTYTEAAALLSTVYPNIFSTKNLGKLCKHTNSYNSFSESPELLPPFPNLDNAGYLLHQPNPEKPTSRIEPKFTNYTEKTCQSPIEKETQLNSPTQLSYEEDFDAESMLDEELEEGIDSIMGNLSVNNDSYEDLDQNSGYYGNLTKMAFGGRFEFGFRFGANVRAWRHAEDGEWWRVPTVEVLDIAPKFKYSPSEKKKKKKVEEEVKESEENFREGLSLKLNYDDVLNAWSDLGSPFSDEVPTSDSPDYARLAQVDLFSDVANWSENGGLREASVLRYREKRRSRLFSKKIRYQVRKVNADRRPRMKGRFVRRPSHLALSGEE